MNLVVLELNKNTFMKKINLIYLFCLFTLLTGCKMNSLESENKKKITELQKSIDSLKSIVQYFEQTSFYESSLEYNYKWFQINGTGFQRVNRDFIVSRIKSKFETNGFWINGRVANLTSREVSVAKIKAAMPKSKGSLKYITGETEVNNLPPGEYVEFLLFIPTTNTDSRKVGIQVDIQRM
jgi:hypothetical protein